MAQDAKVIYTPFNKEQLVESVSALEISNEDNVVTTKRHGRVLATKDVSDNYHVFDFPKFVSSLMENIEDIFNPLEYSLKIFKGKQELRLKGKEVDVNGEQFHEQLFILNSSDKSRALQMHMGLFRLVCTNGMVIAVPDAHSSVRTKHFNNTLPSKVELFMNSLVDFNTIVNSQVESIEELAKRTVSFKKVAQFLAKNEEGEVINSKLNKVRSLSNKLLTSTSDAIDQSGLSTEQFSMIKNPEYAIYADDKSLVDVELNANTIFQCYTEIFRNRDVSIINRESNRIMSALQLQ